MRLAHLLFLVLLIVPSLAWGTDQHIRHWQEELPKAEHERATDACDSIELPKTAKGWFDKGKANQRRSNYAKAIADYSEAIRFDPTWDDLYTSRASAYLHVRQFQDAIADCSKAIRLNHRLHEAFYLRGLAYGGLGKYDNAIIEFTKSVRRHGYYVPAYLNRGLAYAHKGMFDKAIRDCCSSIRLARKLDDKYRRPLKTTACYLRATIYASRGNTQKAIADFAKVIILDPTYPKAYAGRGYLYLKEKKFDKAIDDFAEAIRLDANDTQSYVCRGIAYYWKEDQLRAIADYTEAIRLSPSRPDPYRNRGLSFVSQHEFDKAIADFDEAIRLSPSDPRPYSNRGYVFATRGEQDKAIADFTEALRLDPKDAWLRRYCEEALSDAKTAQEAARPVEIAESDFEELLADYHRYGLPFPPKGAKLVKFASPGASYEKGTPRSYSLGFLLRAETEDNPARLLIGTQRVHLPRQTKIEVVEPKSKTVYIDPRWQKMATFDMNVGLAIALQCKARGWNDLARELWLVSVRQDCGRLCGQFYQPAKLPCRMALAYLVWVHYANEIVKPDTDRAIIARQINRLLVAEPALNHPLNQEFLKALEEAALRPSRSKTGTIERRIDDLTEICNADGRPENADPRYTRLAHMGFAAVPALIEHLDDSRLTRSISRGYSGLDPVHRRVNELVSELLREMAGEEVSKGWLKQESGLVAKADARAWWEKAQKLGEEAYCLAQALPNGVKARWQNHLMLEIIAEKYPKHLAKMYRTILDACPQMQSGPIAELIGRSSLHTRKKQELFCYASHHPDPKHSSVGMAELHKLDPKKFSKPSLEQEVVIQGRSFTIPLDILESRQAEIREVQLYYSMDRGRTWQLHTTVSPSCKGFSFTASKDGLYWFSVRTVDQTGIFYPATDEELGPNLMVLVDTSRRPEWHGEPVTGQGNRDIHAQ